MPKNPLLLLTRMFQKFSAVLKITAWAVIVIIMITACATTDKKALFSETPVALVSVASNYDINWKGEKTEPSLLGGTVRRVMRANEDWVITTSADIIIDEIEGIIRSNLDLSPLVSLAPKDEVLSSRSYNEARINPYQQKDGMITPIGYRLVYYRDRNFFPAFAAETGIKKFLFITLDLTKAMSTGIAKNGTCRARVDMAVTLKDERGKDLFVKNYDISSIEKTKVNSGAYSQEEFLGLLRDVVNDACLDFLEDIGKR